MEEIRMLRLKRSPISLLAAAASLLAGALAAFPGISESGGMRLAFESHVPVR